MNILQSAISNIILSAGTNTTSIGAFLKEHLNADFAMGAVFAGLIFICIIIYLSHKDKPENTKAAAGNPNNVQNINTEELTDDKELVAVITAAIMASLGKEVPADGLYIRSIKRSSGNRWKNA